MLISTFFKRLLPGFVFSAVLFTIYSFSAGTSLQEGGLSLQEAKAYYQNFMSSAQPMGETIGGMTVSRDQYNKISTLLNENESLQGARVYYGVDGEGAQLSIIVGVDASGKDDVSQILVTNLRNAGSCPPVCDSSSPITNE